MEDFGAGAVVLQSLFEEQIVREQMADMRYQNGAEESFAEAVSYFPSADLFVLGPDELSFLNRDMHRVVEPGTFKVMVGGNSSQLTETTLTVDAK